MKELTIDKFLQHRSCLLTEDKLSNEVRIFMAYSFRFLKIFHKFSRIYSLSSFSPPPILSKCLQIFILMFYSTFKFNKFHQLVEDLLLLTCVTVVVKGKVTQECKASSFISKIEMNLVKKVLCRRNDYETISR